jgi:hypothetical protein
LLEQAHLFKDVIQNPSPHFNVLLFKQFYHPLSHVNARLEAFSIPNWFQSLCFPHIKLYTILHHRPIGCFVNDPHDGSVDALHLLGKGRSDAGKTVNPPRGQGGFGFYRVCETLLQFNKETSSGGLCFYGPFP